MSYEREGSIPVTGGEVWYRIAGADAPGVPLLLIHGGPGAPHDYLENIALLADERPVVFYDQFGCGRSGRPDDPSLWRVERFVAELAAVRQALRLDRVNLLGQSWGAMLAVEYLLSGGSGVDHLVLSAPLLSSPLWIADQRKLLEAMPIKVQEAVTTAEAGTTYETAEYKEAMTLYYQRHLCRLDPWPDCLNRTFEGFGMQVYQSMWGPSEFTCTGNLRQAELTPRLPEIDVPTLLTCGRYDEATPITVAEFSRLIPGARMRIFEDASHSHHLEQPDEYLSEVRAFLK
ncbi:MAG: proline iminopeptidase-family hydrolase [Deltaproteobacteria bacterium]